MARQEEGRRTDFRNRKMTENTIKGKEKRRSKEEMEERWKSRRRLNERGKKKEEGKQQKERGGKAMRSSNTQEME